jgi:hypothetical protein
MTIDEIIEEIIEGKIEGKIEKKDLDKLSIGGVKVG